MGRRSKQIESPQKTVGGGSIESDSPFNKDSEHARKTHVILSASARAFMQAGFHDTSLQGIADSLGISKPTLCYYVGSKEEILFKCQHTALEHLRLTIPVGADTGRTGLEQLGEFILHLAEWTGTDFARCLVRCQYGIQDPEALEHISHERKLIDQAVQRIIRRGLKDGSIRRVKPALASAAILGSLNWIATWFDPAKTKQSSRDVGMAFLDIFVAGLAAPSALERQAGG